MAVLYVQENVPFDWLTFVIIAVPVLIAGAIKIVRRFGDEDAYKT